MKKTLQNTLLSLYRVFRASGATATPFGRRIFVTAYLAYKKFWEPDLSHLRGFVLPHAWIVDVGANVGFFSRRFCEWVSEGGRVLAFEPEARNFNSLSAIAAQPALSHVLECRQCLVADVDGELPLVVNPDNPADHRIGASGLPTRSVRLDTVMAELGWPTINLIKIDVQGAEARVLKGAAETLSRSRPALLIELDDQALNAFGSSALAIEDSLRALGYRMFALNERSFANSVNAAQAASIRAPLGYADFLFVPNERVPRS